jgi:hypothetical protein
LVTSSLARLDNPTQSLAAWPVLFQLMLVTRAAAFALPEVVIALTKEPGTFAPLRRFALSLAAVLTAFMVLFTFSPAADFYIFRVQDMTADVGQLARSVLILFLLFPALAAAISWLRGLLIAQRVTKAVNVGMFINLGITVIILLVGLMRQWAGLPTAAIALNAASLIEVLYLGWRIQLILPAGTLLLKPKVSLQAGD